MKKRFNKCLSQKMEIEILYHIEIFSKNELTEQENHRMAPQGLAFGQQKPNESEDCGEKQVDISEL